MPMFALVLHECEDVSDEYEGYEYRDYLVAVYSSREDACAAARELDARLERQGIVEPAYRYTERPEAVPMNAIVAGKSLDGYPGLLSCSVKEVPINPSSIFEDTWDAQYAQGLEMAAEADAENARREQYALGLEMAESVESLDSAHVSSEERWHAYKRRKAAILDGNKADGDETSDTQ